MVYIWRESGKRDNAKSLGTEVRVTGFDQQSIGNYVAEMLPHVVVKRFPRRDLHLVQ